MDRVYDLPKDAAADLNRFGREIAKFERGETLAAEFRVFRVPRGVYEQRESDTYMLRARCPAGMVLPHQMRALAAATKDVMATGSCMSRRGRTCRSIACC